MSDQAIAEGICVAQQPDIQPPGVPIEVPGDLPGPIHPEPDTPDEPMTPPEPDVQPDIIGSSAGHIAQSRVSNHRLTGHGGAGYPEKVNNSNTTSSNPKPPLGKYPQLALCDQVGKAPINARTRITISMVLNIVPSSHAAKSTMS